MTFTDHLNWRRAIKNFDPNFKLSDEQLNKILEATRFAPSSYGIQPYHIFVVNSDQLQDKLREAGYDQHQYTEASHVMVFAARNDAENRIDQYVELASNGDPQAKEKLQSYADTMRKDLGSRSKEDLMDWAARQTYIALGFAMAACAELEIDSCPMEGFKAEEFDKILNLPEHMHTVVTLSLGKRKEESSRDKVRFPKEDLFTSI